MDKTINTYHDLRAEVIDQIENYDLSQYNVDFDDLADYVSEDLYELLRATGFRFGQLMPDVSQETFNQLLKPYEKLANAS
jgi:hypothetical protein